MSSSHWPIAKAKSVLHVKIIDRSLNFNVDGTEADEKVVQMESPEPRRRGRPPKASTGDMKSRLQAAALELFARNGYAGTSIRAIAREVGASESVLYAHFDGKRAIFQAVLDELGPLTVAAELDHMDPTLDPPEALRALIDSLLSTWDTAQARLLISLVCRDGLIHDAAVASAIHTGIVKMSDTIGGWISAGRLGPGLGNATTLAYALMTPIIQARIVWMHGDATPESVQLAHDICHRHVEFFIAASGAK
jgi:AcrR family transcriptional regulator